MALVLYLKYAEHLRGRGDRLAKVSFRGVAHYSRIIENSDDHVVFEEKFEWPVARPVESQEQIELQIFNYSKYLSNRLIGTFRMVLQELVESGHLKVTDCLLDDNNVVMKGSVSFELTYNAPDGSVGVWPQKSMEAADEDVGGMDEERQLLGYRSSDQESLGGSPPKAWRGSRMSLPTHSMRSQSTRAMRSLRSMVPTLPRLSKQRPPPEEEEPLFVSKENIIKDNVDAQVPQRGVSVPDIRNYDTTSDTMQSTTTLIAPVLTKKAKPSPKHEHSALKAQDYQVCVTIIEARQLAGLNMDPVVCVQVGDQKKYTSVKESTNCPYYNEYFVFDFHMAPAMLFDKLITLTVLQSRLFVRSTKAYGSFKLDVGTVYARKDHQFHHKWAMLTDPEDINSGPKGYLKCDISVMGKGDNVKVPLKTDKDEDDIEANLLLPEGVPAERQKAKIIIKMYKAEGLPKMVSGMMATVKKAITGDTKDLVDPYVSVSFAGHKGKTTVRKGCYEPIFNEQLVFTEMFPPLCRRIKIQLRDSNASGVMDDVIGTHHIDLAKISNEGEKGFLPTFGPCWVNLYGSTRNYSILEEHSHLNEGLGEGISYRARLLMAMKTEILDVEDAGPTTVELETCQPVPESAAGRVNEFFLFGAVLDSTMIDKRLGEKPISYELSIGNYGNTMDGKNESVKKAESSGEEEDEGDEESQVSSVEPEWNSVTEAVKPVTIDRFYYFLPYNAEKPVLWVKGRFEDHRKRMYNSNMIEKIAEKLNDGLADVHEMLHEEKSHVDRRLRGVLDELATSCSKYVSHSQNKSGGSSGRTKLDKERSRLCQREIDSVGTMARTLKATVKKTNVKEKLKATSHLLTRIRQVAVEPQDALPDIFIWMLYNNKRVAYQRLLAKDLIFSIVDEERGKDCGHVQTLFMKLPGKRGVGPSGWTIQSKVQVYLWLGLCKHRKECLKGLPEGYEDTPALRRTLRIVGTPPPSVRYTQRQSFQLRAHMYQARSLIGSDNSGLSDPFARVVFGDQSQCTQVIDETLSPTWDEMLIFNEVVVYGTVEQIKDEPPSIVIEIFDQDRVGKSEFIGRALAKPSVKMSHERYERPNFPPQLEWYDVYRGTDKAGELLATFELLQYPFDEREMQLVLVDRAETNRQQYAQPGDPNAQDLPPVTMPEAGDRGPVMPVPKGIRPTLSKHRIEVLFWGMRELKRIQFQSVDKPRIDIECAGHVLSSSIIQNSKKNPNFFIPVKQFDVMLPEIELYCPPITIRCVDCRNFGRFVLVGTHVINHIHKFMYTPQTRKETAKKALEERRQSQTQGDMTLKIPSASQIALHTISQKADEIAITIDERAPLLTKIDPVVTINTSYIFLAELANATSEVNIEGTTPGGKIDAGILKDQKTQENKKKKRKDSMSSMGDDDEVDLDGMDWWSKYHVSMEMMLMEQQQKMGEDGGGGGGGDDHDPHADEPRDHGVHPQPHQGQGYGAIPNGNANTDDPEFDAKQFKKHEKELLKLEKSEEKKHTLKGTAKAVTLAQRLSPKAQRKKMEPKIDPNIAKLKIYDHELEAVPEFNGFKEWLHTFELCRGKRTGDAEDDDSRVVGKFKGALKIYKLPLPPDIDDSSLMGMDPHHGLFQNIPSNEPIHVLVRIYVIKSNDLHPQDLNGKADPYTVLLLGKHKINDKDNYISKQLNPVFGKCFEVEATFPQDSMLRVQVYDWDLLGSDDLIGETHIDLENRYYSRHRATCGLQQKFEPAGYNAWRDPQRPSQILSKLCKDHKLDGPYYQPGKVRVSNRVFTANVDTSLDTELLKVSEEHMALAVLQHWEEVPKVGCKLVPEHVETRPLYNPEKPGIEQGKIEMWVDMFPMDMPPPGPSVDISPRKPKSYELRCIIWNTDDVVLEDDAFFTGEKMSDIYVKGWVKGQDDMQSTDVHYRSLTGEGNFNWRFIFPFDYLVAEEKIVISRKETMFSWDETETKIPARLNLQVWDADHFSADDFLGCLTLDMNCFPRGAKSAKQCSLEMLKPDVPMMNLFKQKRVKGWWPFHAKNEEDEMELTGKVEAELHLLAVDDAEKHPAGLGREEPDPLEKPNRPDSSFIWFLSPLKSIRYILWHQYKWTIIKAILFIMLFFMVAMFFYSMPGYAVKKVMGA